MKLFEVLELLGYSKVSLMFRTLEGIDLAPILLKSRTPGLSTVMRAVWLMQKTAATDGVLSAPGLPRSGSLSIF